MRAKKSAGLGSVSLLAQLCLSAIVLSQKPPHRRDACKLGQYFGEGRTQTQRFTSEAPKEDGEREMALLNTWIPSAPPPCDGFKRESREAPAASLLTE